MRLFVKLTVVSDIDALSILRVPKRWFADCQSEVISNSVAVKASSYSSILNYLLFLYSTTDALRFGDIADVTRRIRLTVDAKTGKYRLSLGTLILPLAWTVGWVGCGNTISEPTGSDLLYVSNKIDPLHFYMQKCHPVKPLYFLARFKENPGVLPAPTVRFQPQHLCSFVHCGVTVDTVSSKWLLAVLIVGLM